MPFGVIEIDFEDFLGYMFARSTLLELERDQSHYIHWRSFMIANFRIKCFQLLFCIACQVSLTGNAIANVSSWNCPGKAFKATVTIDSIERDSQSIVFSKSGKTFPVEISDLEKSEWSNGEVYLSFDFIGPASWSDGAKRNFGFGEFSFNQSADAYELVLRRFDDASGEMEWGPFSRITCKK